jgi:hypothetical protein
MALVIEPKDVVLNKMRKERIVVEDDSDDPFAKYDK